MLLLYIKFAIRDYNKQNKVLKMYLRFRLDNNGKREYTFKVSNSLPSPQLKISNKAFQLVVP